MDYASKDIRNILVAGHAGCGKTTLLSVLLNLLPADSGEIHGFQKPSAVFQEDRLLVYTKDPTEYEVGSILSLSGTIYPIEEPTNPGQFNSRLYYAGKGISYTLYADQVNHMGGMVHPVKEQLLQLQKRRKPV